jgi:glycosyltransferase involved in cell wall biosynthesis
MIVGGAKPTLTIEVGPLMEDAWTGIPVFTRRLVTSLTQHGGLNLEFTFNLAKIPAHRVYSAIALGTGSFLREEFESRSATDYDLADVATPIIYPSSKGSAGGLFAREASTVHDMSTLVMPENHEEANVAHHMDHLERELATNDVTFCITRSTNAALLSAYPSSEGRTRFLYQFVDWPEEFETLDQNLPPPRLGRYAVVVGTVEPRKNLGLLIDALSYPELAQSPLKLLVIGKKGWLVDAFLEGIPAHLRDRLVFSGFVTEFVKYRLIRGADFLIFPSVYEGFGIPALEAMSLGKPVLGAMTSSFPEVIGDGGIYFDPFSPSDFAAAFAEMSHPARLAELSPKAIAQNALFGPERMAQPVVDWVMG